MRKLFGIVLTAVMTVSLVAGCGAAKPTQSPTPAAPQTQENKAPATAKKTAYPITVKDSEGREITLQAEPKRIVSVVPGNTELLFALGKGSSIIAHSEWDDYPAQAKEIKEIVDYFKLDYEKLVAMKPDLILVTNGTLDVRKKLTDEYKMNVFVVAPGTMDDLYTVLKTLGVALDAQEQAEKVVADMKKTVDEVTAKVAKATSKPKVYLEASYDKDKGSIYTTGSGTFQDTLITLAGGINAAAEVKGSWVEYSMEKLAAANPDFIITGKGAAATVKERNGWGGLKAVKESKVFAIDDGNLIARPGPRLVLGLKWMAETIHPELFGK